jgi:galactose mutarotase-like enzyme
MKHSINNDLLQIIVKEVGAELCSIKSLKTHKEYIWQGLPEVWAAHAPNLFPVIGCLKEDGFLYKGREYRCPKHGFIRKNSDVKLLEKTANSLTFSLKYNEASLEIYPFKFEFNIRFILKENELFIEHKIFNHGDDQVLFSLGGHPAFTCPLNKDEAYTDYYLEFEMAESAPTWQVNKDGLIARETLTFFDNNRIIDLHPNLFDNDALVFKNLNSSIVSLKSRKSSQVLTVKYDDFPYLGIWAKPNGQFVCIEPWLGIADSVDSDRNFENKEGLVSLSAQKSFKATYSVSIFE